jgi:hypothetical protein
VARPDKARRREIIRRLKAAEFAVSRAQLGLGPDELDDLHEYLERCGQQDSCDHTLQYTIAWAQERGQHVETLLPALGAFGGFCDCEVLANVSRDRLGWPEAFDEG